jgi:hypothetical protein
MEFQCSEFKPPTFYTAFTYVPLVNGKGKLGILSVGTISVAIHEP